jgi:multidrug efflux system outer membrane protein
VEADYERRLSGSTNVPGLERDLRETDVHSAGFDAVWELDFFGRLRRGIESADATELATVAELVDVRRTVAAEIARNYFDLRGSQKELEVAKANAKTQEETVRLTQALAEAGRATGLDTSRAMAQLKNTLSTVPALEANERTLMYRLAVLTGRQPQELMEPLREPRPVPRYAGPVRIGRPADLLRRRPDIRAVERRLAAANAEIGIAVADLFPRVSFLGNLGVEAQTFSGMFDNGAETYTFGPSIRWAAFDIGRVKSRINAADARTERALALYEETVLNSLEELEGALVRFDRERQRSALLREALENSRRASDLAKLQYNEGQIDFLTLLVAEREVLRAESDATQSDTAVATNLVAVYKALGGGWESEGEKSSG